MDPVVMWLWWRHRKRQRQEIEERERQEIEERQSQIIEEMQSQKRQRQEIEERQSQKRQRLVERLKLGQPIYSFRPQEGEYHTLFDLIRDDDEQFLNYAKMSVASFDELLSLVEPIVKRSSTNYRDKISTRERLILTLRFLATGQSFKDVGYSFRIPPSTVRVIVMETCVVLWSILQNECLPDFSPAMWKQKAKRFGELWGFEFCAGVIAGKCFRSQNTTSKDSNASNDKKFSSLQLLAVFDADLMFTFVEAGDFGQNADGSVFKNSAFGQALARDELNLPPSSPLGTTGKQVTYCFVADEAYPLKDKLMRPYSVRSLDNMRRIFNERLSHVQKTVGFAYSLLATKWEIFQRPLRIRAESAANVVLAACALHNFVRSREGKLWDKAISLQEVPPKYESALEDLEKISHPGRRCDQSLLIRDTFAQYFINEGKTTGDI